MTSTQPAPRREPIVHVLKAWPALVREWDRLTALYEEELPRGKAPKLYALMQQLEGEVRP